MFSLICLSWLLLLLKLLPSHFCSSSLYSLNSSLFPPHLHASAKCRWHCSSLAQQMNRLFHFKAYWMWLCIKAALGTAWKWVITFTFLTKYDLSVSRIASTGPPEERAIVQFQFSVGDKVKFRSKVVYLIFSSLLNLSLNFCLSVYIAVFITHQFLCITCEFHVFRFYYVNIIINKLIYKWKLC